jgi:prepilin-type processing-associated H-X9-DG protein
MNPGGDALLVLTPKSGKAETAKALPLLHGGEGINVVYADCHVELMSTPFCGEAVRGASGAPTDVKDNIYTRQTAEGKGPIMGPSMKAGDAIMLPTADFKSAGTTTKPSLPATK